MGFTISSTLVFLSTAFLFKGAVSQCPHSTEPVKTFGTKCYEFVIYKRLSQHDARTYCSRKHGHLVTIDSQSVQDFVYQTLVSLKYQGVGVWIGLTDEGHENKYTWDSGSTSTYTHWAPGQPGILHSLEDCVLLHMLENGRWHDYRCSDIVFLTEHDAFVCEYNMSQVPLVGSTAFVQTTKAPMTTSPTPSKSTLILTDAVVATDTLPPTTTLPEVLIGKK